jgi:2-amino-4-hydroxy-6-hydroxymethyldihydropteridine diphosphokinase
MHSEQCYVYLLAFGSNLGDRAANLRRGRSFLAARGVFLKENTPRATEPLPSNSHNTADHEHYLNSVAEYASHFSPRELYEAIVEIENEVGHSRTRRWAPRELDVDILFAGLAPTLETPFVNAVPIRYHGHCGLKIPHQGFWERDFLVDMVANNLQIPLDVLQNHRTISSGVP